MTHAGAQPLTFERQPLAAPSRGRGRGRLSGFTLIELILVMAIIAICAMIAAPHLSGSIKARALPNSATDLVTTARWCRVQAITDGLQYRLNLDPTEGRYWVTKDDGSGTNFTQVKEEMGEERKVAEGISMQTEIAPVEGEIFIAFGAGGKTDTGSVTLFYEDAKIEVKCDSPLGSYHIVTPPVTQ